MPQRPWALVLRAAAALALSMGIGRFAYTPILPLMHAQAGLSAQFGSTLATANYLGYLIGALTGIAAPAVLRSLPVLRAGQVVLIGTLLLMAATENHAIWFALRLTAGVASALVFMIAVTAMLTGLRAHTQHLAGLGLRRRRGGHRTVRGRGARATSHPRLARGLGQLRGTGVHPDGCRLAVAARAGCRARRGAAARRPA